MIQKVQSLPLIFLLLACNSAHARYKVGDTVIVIHDKSPITSKEQVLQELPRGLWLKVEGVNGKWLWVSNLATGWIGMQHVTTPSRAIEVFTEQIQQNPQDSGGYVARGMVWDRKGEFENAIGDFNEAIRLAPNHSAAFLNRGVCWTRSGEFDNAIADDTEAIRLYPEDAMAYSNRAEGWVRKAKYDKAIADATEAIRLSPKFSEAYRNRGFAAAGEKQFAKALSDYDEALKLDGKRASAMALRGAAFAGSGDYARALEDFEKALSLDASDEYVWFAVAQFYATCPDAKYRNGQRAVEYAKKACETTNWKSADFLDTLAAACAETGDFKKAVEWQTKAVERASEKQLDDFQARLDLFKSRKPYRMQPVN